jgi:hypothetical protein
MTTSLRLFGVLSSVAVTILGLGSPVVAQSPGGHAGSHGSHGSPKSSQGADPSHAVHESMGGAMGTNPHLRMSPRRVATAADSARAAAMVAEARTALAKYKDVRVAEGEGYRIFAPNVKQDVYHFTQMGAAILAEFTLDIARPTSLLYRKNGAGVFTLVGAMYTAPKNATWDELDARIPLGIARWHLHTNMCVPRLRDTRRWIEVEDGKPVFGPASPIATREACDAVDGRFLPVVFNWMVHANVFESDVWGDHH